MKRARVPHSSCPFGESHNEPGPPPLVACCLRGPSQAATLGDKDSSIGNVEEDRRPDTAGAGSRVRREPRADAGADHALPSRRANGVGDDPRNSSKPQGGGSMALTADQPSRENGHRAKREHAGGAETLGGGENNTGDRHGNVDLADADNIGGVVDAGGGQWQWLNPKKRSGAPRNKAITGDQPAPSREKLHSLASARPSDHSLRHDAGGSGGLDLGMLDVRKRKDLKASLSISSDESEESTTASWLSAASSLRRPTGSRRRSRAKSKKGGSQCSTGFESSGGGSTDSAAFIEAHMPASLPGRRRPSASNGCAGDDEAPDGNEKVQISTIVRSTNGKKAVPSGEDTAAPGTHEQKHSLNGQMPKKSDESSKGQSNAVESRSQGTATAPPPPRPKIKKAEGTKAENGKAPRHPVGNTYRASGEVDVRDIGSMIPKPAVRPCADDRGVSGKHMGQTAASASVSAPPKPTAPAESSLRSAEQTKKGPQRSGNPTKRPSVEGTKQLSPERDTAGRSRFGEKLPTRSRAQRRERALKETDATAGRTKETTGGQGSNGHSLKGEQVGRPSRMRSEISRREDVEFSHMRLVPPDEGKLPEVSPVRTPQAVPKGGEARTEHGQGLRGIGRRTRHLIDRASKVPDREKTPSNQANGGDSISSGSKATNPKPQGETSTRATNVGDSTKDDMWGGLHGDQASSSFRARNPGMSRASHGGTTPGGASTPGSPSGSAKKRPAWEKNGRGGETSMDLYKRDARAGDPSYGASSWSLGDPSFSETEGQDYRRSVRSRDTAAMSAPASPVEARGARSRASGVATPGPTGREVEHYHDYRGGSSYIAAPPSSVSVSGVSYWTDGATERSRSSILTGMDSLASSRYTTEGEPAGGTWTPAKNGDEDHALCSLAYFPPPSPSGEDFDPGAIDYPGGGRVRVEQLAAPRPAVDSGTTANEAKATAEPAKDIDPGQRKEGSGWSPVPSRHPDVQEAGADEQDSVRFPPPSPSTPAAALFPAAAASGHRLPSRSEKGGSEGPRQQRREEDDPGTIRKGATDEGGDSGGAKDHEDDNNSDANRRDSSDEDDIRMSELPRLVYGLKRPVKKPVARRIRRGGSIPDEVLTKAAGSTQQLSKKGSSLYLEGSGNRAADDVAGVESCGGAVEVSNSTWCTPERAATETQSEQAKKPPAAKGWRLPSVRRARDGAKDKNLQRKTSNASSHKSHGSSRFGGSRRLSPAGFTNTPGRHVFEDDSQQQRGNEHLKTSERRHRRKQSRESSKGRSKDDQPSGVVRGEQQEHSEQKRVEAEDQGGKQKGSGEGQAHQPNGNKAKAESGNPASQSGAPRPPGKRPPLVVPPLPRVLNRPYPFDNRGQNGCAKPNHEGNNGMQTSGAMGEEGGNAKASTRSEEKTSDPRPPRPKLIVSASPIDRPQPPSEASVERSRPRNGKGATPASAAAPRHPNPRRFSRGHGTGISDAGSAFSWHIRHDTQGSQGDSAGGDSDYLSLEGIVIPKHFRDGTFGGSDTAEGSNHARNASPSGCWNSGNGACSPSSPPRRGFSRSPQDERKSHSHKTSGRRSARDPSGSASGSTRSASLPSFFLGTSWKSDGGRPDDAAQRSRDGFGERDAGSKGRGAKGVARMCAVLSATWIRRGGNKNRQRESEFHEELQRPTGDGSEDAPGANGHSRSLRRVREDEGIRLAAPDVNRNGGRSSNDRNDDADRRHDIMPEEARDARKLKAGMTSTNEKGRGRSSRDRRSSVSSMRTTAVPVEGGREFEVWREMDDSGAKDEFLAQEGSLCWLNPMGYDKPPIPPGGSLLGTPARAPSSGEEKSFGRDYEQHSDEGERRRMDALLMVRVGPADGIGFHLLPSRTTLRGTHPFRPWTSLLEKQPIGKDTDDANFT